jgi:hypothetical protein
MRPESFPPPLPVFEQFLWDCNLDYDSYEGSKEETVHSILNGGYISEHNKRIIDTAWKFMSNDSYKLRLEQAKDTLLDQIRQIDEALDNLRRFP